MTLSWLDWAIIAAYLLIVLGVGLAFTRRAGKSMAEFFVSGRNLPWWIAGTSMVATSFASDTPLFVTGIVRSSGIGANWLWWSFAIGGMFSVFLLSRLWRRAEVVTDVELTEMRYSGRSAAALRAFRGAYLAIPVNCITMAWVILAMIKLMGVLFDVHPIVAVAVCILLTTAYAVLSGFWGVVVTDLFQFVLAMGGSILLCVITVTHVGGLYELTTQACADGPLGERLLDFFPRLGQDVQWFDEEFWSGPVFALCVFLFVQWWANKNADGGGVVIQRMLASRDEKQSLLATLWFNVANYALRPWPWILVALASVVVFPDVDGEMAYPMMMQRFLPVGLMGLVVASFIGAFMSTIDTHLNLSSAYLVNDVYRRFIRRDAGERHYVLVSRIASVCVMILASLIALVSDSISGLFVFLLAFTSGFGGVLILRWFWWRINAWSELSAMVTSALISSGLYLLSKFAPADALVWLSKPMILLLTVAGSTAVWVVVTFLTAPVSQEKLAAFYRKVRPFGLWGPVARRTGVPPARGLGRMLVNWLGGTVMVLGATLSAGKFLLGAHLEGAAYLAAAAAGAVIVWRAVVRLRAEG